MPPEEQEIELPIFLVALPIHGASGHDLYYGPREMAYCIEQQRCAFKAEKDF
jgi:hypothetical protein